MIAKENKYVKNICMYLFITVHGNEFKTTAKTTVPLKIKRRKKIEDGATHLTWTPDD
jgi:hypothetical protein